MLSQSARGRESATDFIDSGPEPYRDLMSNWTTGVSVVTAYNDGRPAGCTVSSLTSVSLDPPLLLIGLARASRMFRFMANAQTFCVNILADDQGHLSSAFATGGDHAERFADVAVSEVAGAPVIHGCVANAICEVHSEFTVGDRVLVVGQPLQHTVARHREPLAIFRRSWGQEAWTPTSVSR